MALVYSTMLDLGTKLPEFNLINTVNNQTFNSNALSQNKGKVVIFIRNHCPYVIHYHKKIVDISNKFLIYRERLDDSSPENGKEIIGQDLRNAIDNVHVLDGEEILNKQYPSMGCSMKWKILL